MGEKYLPLYQYLINAEATNIVIPHFYNNLPVKEIGDFAFTNCSVMKFWCEVTYVILDRKHIVINY